MKTLLLALMFVTSIARAEDIALEASPAPVTTVTVKGQKILADLNGMTLYTFDPDPAGQSVCKGNCARVWPPLLVSGNENFAAPFGIASRPEGTKQLSINGKPVYLYKDDVKPGDILGDGLNGTWHIILL